MGTNLILFFVGVTVILAVFWWAVFRVTKNTTSAFSWTTLVLCLVVFFFLLPQVPWLVAYLAAIGTLLHAVVVFWFANECSPWFRARLNRERDVIPAIPMGDMQKGGG